MVNEMEASAYKILPASESWTGRVLIQRHPVWRAANLGVVPFARKVAIRRVGRDGLPIYRITTEAFFAVLKPGEGKAF